MISKLPKDVMQSEQAELSEHLRGLTVTSVLFVNQLFDLLGFLLRLWLNEMAIRIALPMHTHTPTQVEKPMLVKEAAEFYGVQENTIYELTKRREIPFIPVGKNVIRIPRIPTIEPINSNEKNTPTRRRNVLP